MIPISVCIIAKNEEKNIEKYLVYLEIHAMYRKAVVHGYMKFMIYVRMRKAYRKWNRTVSVAW